MAEITRKSDKDPLMAETAHFAADCQSGFHTCNNNNKNGRVILSQTKGHKLSVGLSALRFGKRFSVGKCRKYGTRTFHHSCEMRNDNLQDFFYQLNVCVLVTLIGIFMFFFWQP